MALVVFLRGVNVGGHRSFRPTMLAKQLSCYDVVNVGAAGTFVVRKPASRATLRAELLRNLPFDAEIAFCDGRDLVRLVEENPFAAEASEAGTVRFVSVLARVPRAAPVPMTIPPDGEWFVRVLTVKGRFVCGVYRRHMKTIAYLGRIDQVFGAPATTRNWNTILAIVRILEEGRSHERKSS